MLESGSNPHYTELKVKSLLIVTTALLVSTPAMAQQQGHPGQHEGHPQGMAMMAGHCPMMGGAAPMMLLHHADALDLSADQVERIETIRERTDGAAHMQGAMAAHRQAAELMAGDQPDLARFEAKLQEAADHMVQAHTAMARASVEARTVLTPEQRDRLKDMDHAAMGQRGAMGQEAMRGEGMGHGGQGHAGMAGMAGMMDCPMMRGMHGPAGDTPDPGAH